MDSKPKSSVWWYAIPLVTWHSRSVWTGPKGNVSGNICPIFLTVTLINVFTVVWPLFTWLSHTMSSAFITLFYSPQSLYGSTFSTMFNESADLVIPPFGHNGSGLSSVATIILTTAGHKITQNHRNRMYTTNEGANHQLNYGNLWPENNWQ